MSLEVSSKKLSWDVRSRELLITRPDIYFYAFVDASVEEKSEIAMVKCAVPVFSVDI